MIHAITPTAASVEDGVVSIVAGAGFILIGTWAVTVLAIVSIRWLRSRHWFSTTATIISVVIEDATRKDDEGVRYLARINYRYTAGGKEYAGELRRFIDEHSSFDDEAESNLRKYSAGDSVRVWYNPDKPADAVLSRSVSMKYVVMAIAGILLVMLGVSTIMVAM